MCRGADTGSARGSDHYMRRLRLRAVSGASTYLDLIRRLDSIFDWLFKSGLHEAGVVGPCHGCESLQTQCCNRDGVTANDPRSVDECCNTTTTAAVSHFHREQRRVSRRNRNSQQRRQKTLPAKVSYRFGPSGSCSIHTTMKDLLETIKCLDNNMALGSDL